MIEKTFVAGKGIIIHDGKILMLQEGGGDKEHVHEGKWQFPGGRIQFGEHPLQGLEREVFEETGLHITHPMPVYVDHWMPKPFPDEDWHIVAMFYVCGCDDVSTITLSHEHKAHAWIGRAQLDDYPILPEDRKAIDTILEKLA